MSDIYSAKLNLNLKTYVCMYQVILGVSWVNVT